MTDQRMTAPANAGREIEAAQITMGRGLVDVTRIEHEGRAGILFRPRDQHIPVGDEGELKPGEYWPVAGDVVIWIENEGGAQVIQDYLTSFLAEPASSPAGGDVREALKPFADIADSFDQVDPTRSWVICSVLLSDLRRARSIVRDAAGRGE